MRIFLNASENVIMVYTKQAILKADPGYTSDTAEKKPETNPKKKRGKNAKDTVDGEDKKIGYFP